MYEAGRERKVPCMLRICTQPASVMQTINCACVNAQTAVLSIVKPEVAVHPAVLTD